MTSSIESISIRAIRISQNLLIFLKFDDIQNLMMKNGIPEYYIYFKKTDFMHIKIYMMILCCNLKTLTNFFNLLVLYLDHLNNVSY